MGDKIEKLSLATIDFDRVRVSFDGRFCVRDILLCFFSIKEYKNVLAFCRQHQENFLVFDKANFPAQKGMSHARTAQAIAAAQLPFLLEAFNQGILAKQKWLDRKQHKEELRIVKTKETNAVLLQKLHDRNARKDLKENQQQQRLDLAAVAEFEREQLLETRKLAIFEKHLISKARRQ